MAIIEIAKDSREGPARDVGELNVAIAIATTGRPQIVQQAVSRLSRQTRAPDRVVVVGASEADVEHLTPDARLTVAVSEKGSCRQRNHALELIGDGADVVVFMDDDFVPAAGFVAGIARLFSGHPDVAAATGVIIADGVNSAGISFEEADRLVAGYEQLPVPAHVLRDVYGAYGCNMAVRMSAAAGVRFDENLPLYGWQEDIDFTGALKDRGRVVHSTLFAGVHLGVKSGRTSGKRLGYSQVVNPLYLVRKGTLPWPIAARLVGANLLANTVKSLAPEPYVDRRGRLAGNLLGLRELLSGRAHPTRVLTLAA